MYSWISPPRRSTRRIRASVAGASVGTAWGVRSRLVTPPGQLSAVVDTLVDEGAPVAGRDLVAPAATAPARSWAPEHAPLGGAWPSHPASWVSVFAPARHVRCLVGVHQPAPTLLLQEVNRRLPGRGRPSPSPPGSRPGHPASPPAPAATWSWWRSSAPPSGAGQGSPRAAPARTPLASPCRYPARPPAPPARPAPRVTSSTALVPPGGDQIPKRAVGGHENLPVGGQEAPRWRP